MINNVGVTFLEITMYNGQLLSMIIINYSIQKDDVNLRLNSVCQIFGHRNLSTLNQNDLFATC